MDGLIRHMAEAKYRAHAGVANSDLKNLKRSPAYAQWARQHPKGSDAKSFGTAIHAAVLEPEKFASVYVRDMESPHGGYPKGWRNTKVYREWRDQQELEGKIPLTGDIFDAVPQVIENLHADPIGAMIFEVMDGTEFSCFAEDDRFPAITRKCRPDLLASSARTVVDLKTTAVATNLDAFCRQAYQLGYYQGAPYYLDTLELAGESYDHYVFVVVNIDAPYEVNAYTLDEDSMEQGRCDYRAALRRWNECLEMGEFEGGAREVREARIPQWAIDYHERENEDGE